MLDRVTGMRVFSRAAAQGSLSAAGRALGMSPAMATKHMDALEARLGVKLLHRTTRRLTLTEAGRDYLEACQRILQDLDEADSAVAAQRTEAVGRLRMNLPLSFGVRFIAPAGGLPHAGLRRTVLPGAPRHAADGGRAGRP
ncbi:LysR family transcriptional regulator [Alkalilimnicola sp. S0819]|uniref:LysR family transcriptional regulator n=1 Tax=Alkalilimnicola sp. S0819 TaxID=2613922 RepID=UPI001D01359C|nr:LysR family transcriptional regulator [Alkalilimnicola sp. S0819]